MMRSTELWLMSRSCQRATFSSAATALPRSTRARPAEPFAGDGVALVRHGAGAFLALGEELLGFQHFGALEVAELGGPALDAGADQGQRADELGVQVALDHLRGNRRRAQAELAGRRTPRCAARDGRWCRRRRRACPTATAVRARFEPLQRAAKLVVHQRQLQAEGGRLGMDAVAAADHRRELVLAWRLAATTLRSALTSSMSMSARLHHLHGEGGVDNIAAGQAEVEPAAGGRADVLGDVGGEGDDVVVERALQLFAALDG